MLSQQSIELGQAGVDARNDAVIVSAVAELSSYPHSLSDLVIIGCNDAAFTGHQ